jgi:membrane-bound metal-dependent hydrolase YbcI (DUF457 family)
MASPIGHAAVGLAVASVVVRVTGTPGSAPLWIGAVLASGIPDLDVVFPILGFDKRRFHRNWSHSLLVIALEIAALFWLAWITPGPTTGMLLAWSAALVSHPLLDVIATGPTVARLGWGIPLLWPLSRKRYFVSRPITGDHGESNTVGEHLRDMGRDFIYVVPICGVVWVIVSMWR